MAGALAFEGASPDAALFGAVATAAFVSMIRVDADGSAIRIGDMLSEGGPVPSPLSALAWDAARRTLWGASPDLGLIAAKRPDAKRGKLAMPS